MFANTKMAGLRKKIALLLTFCLIFSALPLAALAEDESGIAPFSLLPIEEKRAELDLRGYMPAELKAVSLDTITGNLTDYNGNPVTLSGDVAVWATGYDSDDYKLVKAGETLDLSDSSSLRLVVGTADQLDLNNILYEIYVETTDYDEILTANLVNEERQSIRHTALNPYNHWISYGEDDDKNHLLDIRVSKQDWQEGQKVYLSLDFAEDFTPDGLSVAAYEGYYADEAAIPADAADITAQIWQQEDLSSAGGYLGDFSYDYRTGEGMAITLVFKRGGSTVEVLPMYIDVWATSNYLSYSGIYADGEYSYRDNITYNQRSNNDGWLFMLDEGYPANGTYYFSVKVYDRFTKTYLTVDDIKKAVVGSYETEAAIPSDAEDIKAQLLSDARQAGGGYGADYSQGVSFTVVDNNGEIYNEKITTLAYEAPQQQLPSAPKPLSEDTYFGIKGGQKTADTESGRGDSYNAWVMSYDDDSYYYNGYQTVLLWEYDRSNDTMNPVTENTAIYPTFRTGDTVEMFAGHDGNSGTKQISGQTALTFESGKPILYSAAAENEHNLKNYWVTFLTQQSGPKLFVNAANDEARYVTFKDETTGAESQIPTREVFLTDEYDNHHDVFIANIGDEDITGLYARLEEPENISLDDYWQIGATTTLGAFTADSYSDELNIAKIRLRPAKDDAGNFLAGAISGTLVIGYTQGGSDPVEEVRIKLTGVAGKPQITTEDIVDGVKYVPYSSLIQTNNMYSDDVKFEKISGDLPAGITLRESGELYGVPTVTGEYTFTVKATYSGDVYEGDVSDSKEFTLTINENTDDNIDAANNGKQGHKLLDAVDRDLDITTMQDGDTKLFRSEGDYGDFFAFYLDGQKLVEGQDYTTEEGSTKIVIAKETFNNAGNGQHTIAAEFRAGRQAEGTMKQTSQNVTISGSTKRTSSGGSNAKKYNITADKASGGKVTLTPTQAKAGATVTVTVQPDEGYQLAEITIDGVKLNKVSDTEYTFTMPNKQVVVNAVFELAAAQIDEPKSDLPFNDVKVRDWYYEAIKFVYEAGLMNGVDNDTFAPNATANRAMLVTVLYRLAGEPEVTAGAAFSDVIAGSYYENAISWAAANDIVTGYTEDVFGVEDNVTREQMTAILYRFAEAQGYDIAKTADLSKFTDSAEIADYAKAAMAWATAEELIIGVSEDKLAPQDNTTRAEIATLLQRVCNKYAVLEPEKAEN